MPPETDLVLRLANGGTEPCPSRLPLLSSRGCLQTLQPCAPQKIYRTIDGRLITITTPLHQKYVSTLRCKDSEGIAIEGLWTGAALWVDCIQRLSCPIAEGVTSWTLERDPVEESLFLQNPALDPLELTPQGRQVTWPASLSRPGNFISYRPRLLMRLKDFHLETDEWGLTVGWTMTLEEV